MSPEPALEPARRHAVITVSLEDAGGSCTARARCSCGTWRQAGAFPDYPGRAGAIVLAVQRFTCGTGPLSAFRIARPFPPDPQSVEAAARELDRKSAELRGRAAALLAQAAEYEAASKRLKHNRF